MAALSDEQLERYARHIVLREVGGAGQAKLLAARVLVVGAGGLGQSRDPVSCSGWRGHNRDRRFRRSLVIQSAAADCASEPIDRGGKDRSAAEAVLALNPDVCVEEHNFRITAKSANDLVQAYDIVADGSDNFATRFLLNDTCYFARRTLVSAAVTEFDGQLATFKAFDRAHSYPCYRCLFPEAPPPGSAPSCSETGILGAAAGVMGTLQALEVMKEIIGAGENLAGHLLIYDALATRFRKVKVPPDPACILCGENPTILSLE